MAAINDVVDLSLDDGLAIVTLDSPPVNALSPHLMDGIYHAFVRAIDDPAVKVILLICAGRTFIAGADIKALGNEEPEVDFFDLQARIENAGKPVVAAIHGTCLGGGLEVALTCSYRVAVPSARLGLPEVNLGLLPGGGGTQRLPRIVGIGAALDLLISGRQIGASEALEVGLLDLIVAEGDLRGQAIGYARRLAAKGGPAKRIRDLTDAIGDATPAIFAEARIRVEHERTGELAPLAIIRCVEAAAAGDFDAGIAAERAEFNMLLNGAQSAALRHAFFAERQAAKVPGVPKETEVAPLTGLAVVGDDAGRFSELARQSGLQPVALEAISPELADIQLIVKIGSGGFAGQPALRDSAPHAVVAIDAPGIPFDTLLAGSSGDAEVVGFHINVDVPGSRLADIVRGPDTEAKAIATAMVLARKLGKVGIVASSGGLGIGERLLRAARAAVDASITGGADPADIAQAAARFGFRTMFLAEAGLPAVFAKAGSAGSNIADRLIFGIIDEALKLVEEGVALRGSDVDMAAILGLGWPSYTGGPIYHAQAIGLDVTADWLASFGFTSAAILGAKANGNGVGDGQLVVGQ